MKENIYESKKERKKKKLLVMKRTLKKWMAKMENNNVKKVNSYKYVNILLI